MTARDSEAIGRAFVGARRSATPLPDYPGPIPQTLDQGYAAQDAAIAAHGGTIAGWKVGRILPPLDATFGADRLAGPIFADSIRHGDEAEMRVFAGGFGAVEAEFLFRLGAVDPDRRRYTIAEALEHVTAAHVGIEIASSPFPGINAHGPGVTISDFGNNNGLIVGAGIPDWRAADLDGWPVETLIDDAVVGTGQARAFPDGVGGAVRFLLELLAARRIALPEGTWISSGAVTGVHPIAPGQRALARFGADYRIRCTIAAEEPRS